MKHLFQASGGDQIKFSPDITEKLYAEVLKKFEARREAQGWKFGSKKAMDMQREFMMGVVALLDILSPDKEHSTITPRLYFEIIRGHYLKAEDYDKNIKTT